MALGQAAPSSLPCGQPVLPPDACVAGDPGPSSLGWLKADYLLWWVKSAPNPVPIVTTGPFNPDTFTGAPIPAAIGSPGTRVLYGAGSEGFSALSGLRLEGGTGIGDCKTFAVEGGLFLLEHANRTFTARSDAAGNPFLAFPLHNALSGLEGVNAISFPSDTAQVFGGQAGTIQATASTRLWGGEANLAMSLWSDASLRVIGLVGFRYVDLDESMGINAAYTPLAVAIPLNAPLPMLNPGDRIALSDSFHTRNQFYGGQVGARVNYTLGSVDLGLTAKLALGSNQERVSIQGSTTALAAGQAPVVVPGGIFTTLSNIGTYHRGEFCVIPEVGLNVGVQLTQRLRARAGYSFLYWSQVIRPGNTIDRTIDQAGVPTSPTFTPGFVGTHPLRQFHQSDFWAQGLNLGLELSF
jgi:hypothetical protein